MTDLNCFRGRTLTAFCACLLVTTSAHAATGRTPGSAAVTSTGEAAYSIPITLPAGTNGLTPSLSLEYRHNSHGGLVGVGWSIGGLSAIQRCHQTLAQDGVIGPGTSIADVRYCLDGERLMLSSGLLYWDQNAEYRTEHESFSRIKRFGGLPNWVPDYFTVESPDGLIGEYGGTTDSRGGWAWRISQIRDRSGNVINFKYTIDGNSRRIERISYNANPSQSVAASHEILFVYENRPSNEIDLAYIAGTSIRQITRLDRMDVLYNNSVIKRYELSYEPSLSSAGHSRLASLQECGVGGADCFVPTNFLWQNGTLALSGEQSVAAASNVAVMDINGDGRSDLLWGAPDYTTRYRLALGTGGFGPEVNAGSVGGAPFNYNGDSYEDLLSQKWVGMYQCTWQIAPGGPAGVGLPIDTGLPCPYQTLDYRGADMNGDGLGDIVYSNQPSVSGGVNDLKVGTRLALSGGGFSEEIILYEQNLHYSDYSPGYSFIGRPGERIDLDGDGREDLLLNETYTIARISLNEYGIDNFDSNFWPAVVLDVNGDGCTDFLYVHYTGNWRTRFSGCSVANGMLPELIGPSGVGAQYNPVVLDWNSDGKDDVLFRHSSGDWKVMISNGEALLAPIDSGIPSSVTEFPARADFNGDSLDDLVARTSGTTVYYRIHSGVRPDLLVSATDGYGVAANFAFQPLTAAGVYSKGTSALFPDRDAQDGTHVVTSLIATDGTGAGSTTTRTFTYEGLRYNLHGRGILGFARKITVDATLGYNQRYEDFYLQQFPFIGLPSSSVVKQATGQPILDYSSTWSSIEYSLVLMGTTRKFPYIASSQTKRYEVGGTYNGTHLSTVTSSVAAIDSGSGLITDQTSITTEIATGLNAGATYTRRFLHSSLFNDTTNWCLGRPQTTQAIASHTLPDGNSITRTESATWDGVKCRPTQLQIEPGHASLQVTIAFTYDAFGNAATETVTGVGMTPRQTQTNWGPRGQLPATFTNPLGHLSSQQWRYDLGLPTSLTDPNGLLTSWDYDAFGRPTLRIRPELSRTTWSWTTCPGCGPLTRLRVLQDERDSSGLVILPTVIDLDQFDRPYNVQSKGIANEWSVVQSEFDARGRPIKRRAPYWSSIGPGEFALAAFDMMDRVVSAGLYSSAGALQHEWTFSFNGLSNSRTSPLQSTETTIESAWGDTVRATDPALGNTNFRYNSFGQLTRVTDTLGNVVDTTTYDIRGLKANETDIDLGQSIFVWNALGELVSQTDAKGQVSTFSYDLIGRMTSRVEPAGTSSWTWGNTSAAKNIGRIASFSGFGYSEEFTHDQYSRLSRRRIISDATYDFDYSYDSVGLLDTIQYPTSTSNYRLTLKHDYLNGQLKRIKDALVPTTVLWEVNATDAAGEAIDVSFGANIKVISGFDPITGLLEYRRSGVNGSTAIQNLEYDWNAVGRLTKRADLNQSGTCSGSGYASKLCETFTYDVLGRLDLSQRNGSLNLDVNYDAIGNITSKTSPTDSAENVGTYNYTSAQSGCTYYTHNQRHAVRKAGTTVYCYDANGNMTKRAGATVSWYSYNLPNTINQSGGNYSQFYYGPERNRWKQVANYAGVVETTIYVGGLVEKVTKGGVTTWKHYVQTPTGTAALYLRRSGGTPAEETYYLTQDHLGSTDKLIRAAGVVVAVSESFGAFGRRRGATWTGLPTAADWTAIGASTRDGFTGHEQVDNLTLVHMSGRVFEPRIGRFMSADPLVQSQSDGPSWNRYSYVRNGPLSATDPTGFCSMDVVEHSKCLEVERQRDLERWIASRYADFGFRFGDPVWSVDRDPCSMIGSAMACAFNPGMLVPIPASDKVQLWTPPPSEGAERAIDTSKHVAAVGNSLVDVMIFFARVDGQNFIGSNFKSHRPLEIKFYSGLRGNQYSSTVSLQRLGKLAGTFGLLYGGVTDVRGILIYQNFGADAPGAVSPHKAGVNLSVGAISLTNPLSAVTVGAPYALLEAFYPGGAAGALDNNARIQEEVEQIVPGFKLYRTSP